MCISCLALYGYSITCILFKTLCAMPHNYMLRSTTVASYPPCLLVLFYRHTTWRNCGTSITAALFLTLHLQCFSVTYNTSVPIYPTLHLSEEFTCSLQPSPCEAAGGLVGAVPSCPGSLLPLAIFLEWWQQPSLPWPWQPWLYHGGPSCILASCLSCMASLSFSSNNGLG